MMKTARIIRIVRFRTVSLKVNASPSPEVRTWARFSGITS